MKLVARLSIASLCIANAVLINAAQGDLKIPGLFSDHMIFQREIPLKVWGKAAKGAKVKVAFNGASDTVSANDKGEWTAKLPEQKAGGPFELTVSSDDETTTIKDVLVGEVWVCSGQSNMDFVLKNASNGKEAIRSSSNDQLRLFRVPKNRSTTPIEYLTPDTTWRVADPDSTPDFTAVGYFFGRDIQKELNVPVGLIHTAWGGTKVEWWTPLEGLKQLPFYKNEAQEMTNPVPDEVLVKDFTKADNKWKRDVAKADKGRADNAAWAKPGFDDSAWQTVKLPATFGSHGLASFDGSVWYRKTIELTAAQIAGGAELHFTADDDDFAFVNGKVVGRTFNGGGSKRDYTVPAKALNAGKNTIALQVLDWGKDGGIPGDSESLTLVLNKPDGKETIALAGDWKFTSSTDFSKLTNRPVSPGIRPTTLYNAMVAPLTRFAIRGAIWYQGENNANPKAASNYDKALAEMIAQWRSKWAIKDFPFYQVQLASFRKIEPEPGESDWAVLRESQANVQNLTKNAGFASAIDVGEQDDIHPKDKATVGYRLALNALALTYGKKMEYTGPTYKSAAIDGNRIAIEFDHGHGLKTKDGAKPTGFAIAGADKQFVWGDATIENNKVIVTHPDIKEPKYVRYGWANYSTGNLYNDSDLPANPFRTDNPEAK